MNLERKAFLETQRRKLYEIIRLYEMQRPQVRPRCRKVSLWYDVDGGNDVGGFVVVDEDLFMMAMRYLKDVTSDVLIEML